MFVLVISVVLVNFHVRPQIVFPIEFLLTHRTLELLLRRIVCLTMTFKMLRTSERFAAHLTSVHFNFLRAWMFILHMFRHRVQPHELLVAHIAVEFLRFVLALRFEMFVQRISVGKGLVAGVALVDAVLQLSLIHI